MANILRVLPEENVFKSNDVIFSDGTDITNAGSTGVTFITDPPDDSGSGQGNTICTQRTIARQTRIVDRL